VSTLASATIREEKVKHRKDTDEVVDVDQIPHSFDATDTDHVIYDVIFSNSQFLVRHERFMRTVWSYNSLCQRIVKGSRGQAFKILRVVIKKILTGLSR
jgi:hypothetical protein